MSAEIIPVIPAVMISTGVVSSANPPVSGRIAHALEACAGGGPLRPRAVYTGRLRSSTRDPVAVCYRFVT